MSITALKEVTFNSLFKSLNLFVSFLHLLLSGKRRVQLVSERKKLRKKHILQR